MSHSATFPSSLAGLLSEPWAALLDRLAGSPWSLLALGFFRGGPHTEGPEQAPARVPARRIALAAR